MPQTSAQRLENSFMPPKKFAWRLNNSTDNSTPTTPSSLETDVLSSVKQGIHKMRISPENERHSSSPTCRSPILERKSPVLQPMAEDIPLDFSIKHDYPKGNNGSNHSALAHSSFQESMKFSDRLKMIQINKSAAVFPGMPDGTASPPKINGSHWSMDGSPHHENRLCNESQNYPKMDSLENNTAWNNKREMNGESVIYEKSPKRSSFSKESSPVKESPILQKMLVSQDNMPLKSASPKVPDTPIRVPESYQHGSMNDALKISSPTMPTVAPPIAPSLLSPVNGYSLPMHVAAMPFFSALGYAAPPIGAMPGSILTGSPEVSTLQAVMARRQKKKRLDDRPFKSFPMDVLQKKLQCVSGAHFALGQEYNKQISGQSLASRTPPADSKLGDDPSKKRESSEIANGAMNFNNVHTTNGTNNPPHAQNGSGDSNDSVLCVSPEGAENSIDAENRKRKTTADVEKDDAYWDRRKKNNLAAKRSREARRQKEDAIAKMAVYLETQNGELRGSLTSLNYSYADLLTQFNVLRQDYEALKIQNNVLQERLSQKRCGQCGAELPCVN